jgi:hypothetical protein
MTPTEAICRKYTCKETQEIEYEDIKDLLLKIQKQKSEVRYDLNRAQRRALKKAKK